MKIGFVLPPCRQDLAFALKRHFGGELIDSVVPLIGGSALKSGLIAETNWKSSLYTIC
jgi:hypothetical protein